MAPFVVAIHVIWCDHALCAWLRARVRALGTDSCALPETYACEGEQLRTTALDSRTVEEYLFHIKALVDA